MESTWSISLRLSKFEASEREKKKVNPRRHALSGTYKRECLSFRFVPSLKGVNEFFHVAADVVVVLSTLCLAYPPFSFDVDNVAPVFRSDISREEPVLIKKKRNEPGGRQVVFWGLSKRFRVRGDG